MDCTLADSSSAKSFYFIDIDIDIDIKIFLNLQTHDKLTLTIHVCIPHPLAMVISFRRMRTEKAHSVKKPNIVDGV